MLIEAIVFDLDDTLYSEIDYVISGMKVVNKWIQDNYGITGFYDQAMMLINSGEKKFIFNKVLQFLNINYDEELIHELVALYRNHDPNIHLLDDAKWVLNHLIDTAKLGLITDGFLIAQEQKVKVLNLKERFNSIVFTDKLGRENWKPSPLPYQQVSRELNVPPHRCVYIGDNVSKDFITAKKLGWQTVHIQRDDGVYSNINRSEEYHAHYNISDLRALRNYPIVEHLFKRDEIQIEKGVNLC